MRAWPRRMGRSTAVGSHFAPPLFSHYPASGHRAHGERNSELIAKRQGGQTSIKNGHEATKRMQVGRAEKRGESAELRRGRSRAV
jgi:hypothetical protein